MKTGSLFLRPVLPGLIFLLIASCGDDPLRNMKNFTPNRAPVISGFSSSYSGEDIVPGLVIGLTVSAYDPEEGDIITEFLSDKGSFTNLTRSLSGSTVNFVVGEISGGEEVPVSVKVTDTKGASAAISMVIGASKQGPMITRSGDIPGVISADGYFELCFTSDSDGYYQLRVLDDPGAEPVLDQSLPLFIVDKDVEISIPVCGPANTTPVCSAGAPRLNSVGMTPDLVSLIVTDRMGQEARIQYIVAVNGSEPVPGNGGRITTEISSSENEFIRLNWTLATDTETSQEELEYRVYVSENGSLGSVEAIESGGTPLTPWEKNFSTFTLDNFDPDTDYRFNVLVRDRDGFTTNYKAALLTTPEKTPPVPGNNGIVTAANVTPASVLLSWTKASDNRTPEDQLEYRIMISREDNMDTPLKAEANGTEAMGWSRDRESFIVQGLEDSNTYFFAVLVRDGAGNVGGYGVYEVKTLDGIPPVPGDGGNIVLDYVFDDQIDISWQTGNDNNTSAELLQYKIFYSTNDNISTINDVLLNGISTDDWEDNISSYIIYGLSEFTNYYITVLIKDESENISIYKSVSAITPSKIYLFSTLDDYDGNLGNRADVDNICKNYFDHNFSNINISKIRAIISTSENDSIYNMPENYGIPDNYTLKSFSNRIFAENWSVFRNSSDYKPYQSLWSAWVTNQYYWTGSGSNSQSYTYNCVSWTSNSSQSHGVIGSPNYSTYGWLYYTITDCNNKHAILCVGWN